MILALALLPAAAGALAFFIRNDRVRRALLLATAFLHLALVASFWVRPPAPALSGWFALDAPGRLVLTLTSTLFCAAAVYGVGYLARESHQTQVEDWEEGYLFTNVPEAVFTGCLLGFLGTMSFVAISRHLGVMWVAIEATTLASAPLLYFHRHARSLEATWKYLLLCSVGIGIALLGNFCLEIAQVAASAATAEGVATAGRSSMILDDLLLRQPAFHPTWLRVGFLCLLVGYGTKMGLAPLHAWLPDAHSEAPSLVSALLSGALLNCAFLGILRGLQVLGAAGDAAFGQPLLIGFGLLSMAFAAVFVIGQASFKRMLAWSSVEHMGLLAFAVGVGGGGASAALLHAVNHSLTKGMLFLLAGNILGHYRSRASADVTGLLRALPVTGLLWVMGFFAITGAPPFGPFLSELLILKSAFDQGRSGAAIACLVLLMLIFFGMARAVLRMAHGKAPAQLAPLPGGREPWLSIAPPALLGALVVCMGLWVPPALQAVIAEAAQIIGGR